MNNSRSSFSLNSLIISSVLMLVNAPVQAAVLDFESGDFTDWNTSGNTSIQISLYGVTPTSGTYQGLLETDVNSTPVFDPLATESLEGLNVIDGFLFAGSPITDYGSTQGLFYTQGSAIKLQNAIIVNSGQTVTIAFDYNFLTNEAANGNDDLAFFSLNEQLIPLASVKSSSLNISTGTPYSRSTGYQPFTYTLSTPGSYILGFGVLDEFDFATTSGLLLDNISLQVTNNPQSVPESSGLWGLGTIGLLIISNNWRKVIKKE